MTSSPIKGRRRKKTGFRVAASPRPLLRTAHGIAVEVVTADLVDSAQLEGVLRRLRSGPPIDILVNNAGAALLGMPLEAPVTRAVVVKRFLRSWQLLMQDAGVNGANVLRRAQLPGDLLARENARLDSQTYFRLWSAIEAEAGTAGGPAPLRFAEKMSADWFDPELFVALCSADMSGALDRHAACRMKGAPSSKHSTRCEIPSHTTTFKTPRCRVRRYRFCSDSRVQTRSSAHFRGGRERHRRRCAAGMKGQRPS